MHALDDMVVRKYCKIRSELIEKSIKFYDGYVRTVEENEYLPIALSSAHY